MGDTLSTSDGALQELAPASQTQLTHLLQPSHTQHFTVTALLFRGPQGERGLAFLRRKEGQTFFFPLLFLRII